MHVKNDNERSHLERSVHRLRHRRGQALTRALGEDRVLGQIAEGDVVRHHVHLVG